MLAASRRKTRGARNDRDRVSRRTPSPCVDPHPIAGLGQRQVLRVDGLVHAPAPRCPQAGPLRRPAVARRRARARARVLRCATSRPAAVSSRSNRTCTRTTRCAALPRGTGSTSRSATSGAESTGLPSASVDAVICTLVLCTVDDPAAALAEVRRILRPGGRFVFIEHVGSGPGPLRAIAARVASAVATTPSTAAASTATPPPRSAAAGFSDVRIEHFRLGGAFVPVWPQISGYAVA